MLMLVEKIIQMLIMFKLHVLCSTYCRSYPSPWLWKLWTTTQLILKQNQLPLTILYHQ